MKIRRVVSDWVPVAAWICLIFAGSTDLMSAAHTSRFLVPFLLWLDPDISLAAINTIQFAVRKAAHFTEYAILSALLWRGVRHSLGPIRANSWKPAALVLVFVMIHAAADEFHQSFVPSRSASPQDVMIDIAGALLGLMICWAFTRNQRVPAASAA